MKNISGKQTRFKFTGIGITGSAFVEDVQISSLQKNNTGPIALKGFKLKGKEMNFFNASIRVNSENFILADNFQEFSGTRFQKSGYGGTLVMNIPSIHLTNEFSSFFNNDLHFKNISLKSPVIDFQKQNNTAVTGHNTSSIPAIKIDHISMREPVFNVQVQQDTSLKKFSLPWSKGSEINIDDVEMAPQGITVGALNIQTQKAEIKVAEKAFVIDDGLDVSLSKINISPPGNGPSWAAMLTKLHIKNSGGFTFDIKDNKLWLKDITVGDGRLSSSSINNIDQLISTNRYAWVSTSAAKYSTKNSLWQSFNVSYNAGSKVLALDSFNYYPSIPRDSFIAANPYQVDYISFSSGNTRLYGFDILNILTGTLFPFKKQTLASHQ